MDYSSYPRTPSPSLLQELYDQPINYYNFFSYDHFYDVKLEESPPIIVPSQSPFYPQSQPSHELTYLSPHTGLPVQHTDDAASKETQYLRRRCFNCHTTEPPSWRRSTLNPGKIVCNKCGLYERTHLRPRPLRFDELRAGNKSRKQAKPVLGSSPKVKKEPREFAIARRSSVSSNTSSVHSSDWDDNVSVYSSGSSVPSSSFSSPSISTFPIPRDPASQSPPLSGGIRLPNAPLSDIASLSHSPRALHSPPLPRKSNTAPSYYPSYPHDSYRRSSLDHIAPDHATSWMPTTISLDGFDADVLRCSPPPIAAT